jgi:hypothetical protein
MRIIGCDFHSRYQQIAMLETETGEVGAWPPFARREIEIKVMMENIA